MAHRPDALSRPGPRPSPPPSPPEEPSAHRWQRPLILILALAELAYLAWFLIVPMPNIENLGHVIGRWIFLAHALPELFAPGMRFEESHLGHAVEVLLDARFLPQRLPIVLVAGEIAAAAVALGSLGLRALGLRRVMKALEYLPLSFLLGVSGLGVATLIVGRFGGLGPWRVRLGLGMPIVFEAACLLRERRTRTPMPKPAREAPPALPLRLVLGLAVAPFLLVMALGAMLPTVDYDAIEYHLQGPKEYYQAGRIAFLPHNVYTSMPSCVEMLHLLGMEVFDDWWWGALAGQLLVACFAPAAATLVALTAGRWGSPRAAWFAAFIYLTTPWVYRLAELPYVEGPLCAYHAALIWMAGRAWTWAGEPRLRARLWGVVGLLAGGAMACKYPSLVTAVLPFGALALAETIRRRSGRAVLAYILGWSVIMTPWLVRNLLDTGNPVYPLAYSVFGGREWDAGREAQWTSAHGPRPINAPAFVAALLDVAGRSDWHSPLYAMLAPLALVRRDRRRPASMLLGYVAYLFLTWWLLTHRLDRFWLPLLPALAVLAGLGTDWTRDWSWSLLLGLMLAVATMFNFTFISTAIAGFNEWTSDLRILRTRVPALINPSLAVLNAMLPSDARVLLVGQAAVFHLDHPVVYNTVFNRETFETIASGRSPAEVGRELHRRGITHIYVDWYEIERYRSPGNYGFTPFVTPEVFDRLVSAGVLDPPESLSEKQKLYRVR